VASSGRAAAGAVAIGAAQLIIGRPHCSGPAPGPANGRVARYWALLGFVPPFTGLFRFCPAYTLLGVNTCPMNKS